MIIIALLTTDESRGMDEYTSVDARRLGKLLVAQAPPSLRERLAALEALGGEGHSLNAPVAAGLVGIDDVDGLLGLDAGALISLQLEQVLLKMNLA